MPSDIHLYNSISRKIERFVPLDPKHVKMYVCGPTVYDEPHIGNARPAVVFDVLHRLLRYKYRQVIFARNFTDIDDKIIVRARENGETIYELTDRNIKKYQYLMEKLNIEPPSHNPRATEYVEHIVRSIVKLIDAGYAYVSHNNVLFDIDAYSFHGKLSQHDQKDLEAGLHRIATEAYKKGAGDFVLWKPSDDTQPGWASPWGLGRPGWHIECSSMIENIFEFNTIDIHGGGADLRFPHHECEISQFESINHKILANYWVHNGMLTVDGKKMAKSVGNILNVSDLLNSYAAEEIRLALLMTHYRSNIDWTNTLIKQSRSTILSWMLALENAKFDTNYIPQYCDSFIAALNDDLNTPNAIKELHYLFSILASDFENIASSISFCSQFLGIVLNSNTIEAYLRGGINQSVVEELLAERKIVRQQKNYEKSDQIRATIKSMNLVVDDQPDGSVRWYKNGIGVAR